MFPTTLKSLRTSRNLLQKDIALFLGITTSAYGFYEQGKRDPDTDTLKKLADFFNVSTDYLLGREVATQTNKKPISKREILLNKLENLTDEELLEMEQIADYIKSKKEKNDQAATTA